MNKKRCIALGFFDGVHLGHAGLMRKTLEVSEKKGLAAAVLTFDRHPQSFITNHPEPLINSPEDRQDIIKRLYGIDEIIVAKFSRRFMQTPWQDFIKDFLINGFSAGHIVVGDDYRFGHKGQGTPVLLKQDCRGLGVGVDIIDAVSIDGVRVSSTHIRGLLAEGDIKTANRFLGHKHQLTGPVIHGQKIGRTLDIPTINMSFPEGVICPRFGVYKSRVFVQGKYYSGITNIGVRPTFEGEKAPNMETLIFDFKEQVYQQTARVELIDFIRPERKFDTPEQLKAQILQDIACVKSEE